MPRATACSSSTIRMVAATAAMLHRAPGTPPHGAVGAASWYRTRPLRAPRHIRPRRRAAARPDRHHDAEVHVPMSTATARPTLAAEHREITGKKVAACAAPARCRPSSTATASSPSNVTVDTHEFEQLRRHAGPNALVDLSVDGKKAQPVLVHGVQVHPVNRRPLHVDLFLVAMTEELTVDVPLVATGESPAVDDARRHAPPPDRDRPGPGAARSPAAVDRVLGRVAGRLRRARSTSAT